MAMNLEYVLLLQKFGLLNSQKSRFLDIGPQNVYFCTAEQIGEFLVGQGLDGPHDPLSTAIERLVYYSTPRPNEQTTLLSEIVDLAGIEYNSFDVCPALKTELLDLNFDTLPDKYRNYYDIVTNFGTTEHVFNQWNCFAVMHGATRIGGAMYHVVPAIGYLDHGYYCYTPLFFRDLARANGYEIVDMFMSHAADSQIEVDVRLEQMFDTPGSGALSPAERRLPGYNLHAILRKRVDGPFRAALEVATTHAKIDARMNARYAGSSPDPEAGAGPSAPHDEFMPRVERLVSERDHLQRESLLRMRQRDEKSAEIIAKEAYLQEQLALVAQLRSERDHLQRESLLRMQQRDDKSAEIAVKEARIQELVRACADRDAAIRAGEAQLQAIYRSTCWRMSKPLRALRQLVRQHREI